ncbi:hypothetical protein SD70_11550 [Gordoniibacillus kamchatkensis]|uniref:DUF2269 family protein n=1 Tax=Gordoniibacillus kamchatkensis TaxID=1590651 RepID=A0ABR5AI88_9BACL|nr:hypothetical protein [Paenibacillus sp. VKM B-2647]KIL40757.1 hypothetical protein SD70_11550 [Paenibacillus sp. VKM B-2647]
MSHWMLFLHIVGALAMGFYFLLPFLVSRAGKMSGAAQAGYAAVLRSANRIAQFVLLFEFLTGGYLVSKYSYSPLWLILVLVFVVALGAVTGILGVRLKKLGEAAEANGTVTPHQSSSLALSWISAVFLLVIVYLMNNIGAI